MRLLLTTAFACLLSACGATATSTRSEATAPSPGAAYPIRLSRDTRPGATWREHVELRTSQRESTTLAARNVADERTTLAIDLDARITVREVDERGRATRTVVSVERFVVDTGQGPITPVIPGELVVSRLGGTIESPAGALDPQTLEWLGEVLEIDEPRDASDDDIFGTREPQPIGASWGIDTALAARSLATVGVHVRHDHLGGQARLVDRVRLRDVDCLLVRAELSARGIEMPSLPPGARIARSDVRGTMESALPLDLARRPQRETVQMQVRIELEMATEAGTATVRLDGEQHVVREIVDE